MTAVNQGIADTPPFIGRKAQMFPQLSAAQIARLEAHASHRQIAKGEILAEPGDRNRPMLVVLSGSIEVVQPGLNGEVPIVVHAPGSFTGEMSTLQGVGARAIIIATGAEYRQLAIESVSRFLGTGVYYAATATEAQRCEMQDVIVVGGGNSAGQAAVYLLRGDDQVDSVVWRTAPDNVPVTHAIGHVFLMTGAVPSTHWLKGCVALDDKGFVRTGSDLTAADFPAANATAARLHQALHD